MGFVGNPTGSGAGKSKSQPTDRRLHDPFRHVPFSHFIKSSTFWDTWPSVVFFALEAFIICYFNAPNRSLSMSTTILSVLGTLIGFSISYRTSSAYTQYIEARKAWGSVIHQTRVLSRVIWLHVPNELSPHTSTDLPSPEEKVRAMVEKKTMLNLLRAFSVSLKHHVRGEYGIFYEDLYHLTCLLPKYNHTGSASPNNSSFVVELGKPYSPTSEDGLTSQSNPVIVAADPTNPPMKLLPAYNPPPKTKYDYIPLLRIFRTLFKGTLNATGHRKASDRRYTPEANIPMEIMWQLSIYLSTLQVRKVIDAPSTTVYNNGLMGLSDALANIERILTTPMPYGYHVHLKTIIWGYLALLPFQLIATFKYITIPVTAFIAFAFLGFLQIGQDIENPFGYDENDLGLDHFCHDIISREIQELTSSIPSGDPLSYVFTSSNMPLLERGNFQTGFQMSHSLLPFELEGLLSEPCKSTS